MPLQIKIPIVINETNVKRHKSCNAGYYFQQKQGYYGDVADFRPSHFACVCPDIGHSLLLSPQTT
jgi:hypothetical protein